MLNALKKKMGWGDQVLTPQYEPLILTPDIWQLEQFQHLLLFVPDDLMRGGHNHNLLMDHPTMPELVHPTCYTSQPFHFFRKDLGEFSFPVAMSEDYKPSAYIRSAEPARIRGELWKIRPQQFISLDKFRQNGIQFRRERRRITYPVRPVSFGPNRPLPEIHPDQVTTVMAWMYVGIPKYWDSMIGGVFNTHMDTYEPDLPRKWIDRYYKFDPK